MRLIERILGKDTPKAEQEKPVAVKDLFAEWREDYRLANERLITGKEPERKAPEATAQPAPETAKVRSKRVELKGHDIPF